MWGPNCFLVGVSLLLLLGQIVISELCRSLITMVDGFHTLLILIHATLPPAQTANSFKPPLPPVPPAAAAAVVSEKTSNTGHSVVNPHEQDAPDAFVSLSYTNSRTRPVGIFISSLFLVSLCISYFMEIVGFMLHPHSVHHPLLPVTVGAVSVLCKVLVFVLHRCEGHEVKWEKNGEIELHPEVNRREEDSGKEESKTSIQSKVQSTASASYHSQALVLCNPGTSDIQGTEGQIPPQHTGNASVGLPVSSVSVTFDLQGLLTSLLALTNSLVTQLIASQHLHRSPVYSGLRYLDPAVALLAVIIIIATTLPELYRLGLLLLQASPSRVCMSDLGRRLAEVRGVKAVHDLHVWELNESVVVASVHVHCDAGYQTQRCSDLVSEVTEVLQSVGASCCTVQLEFPLSPAVSSCTHDNLQMSCTKELPSPSVPRCSLTCGKACAGKMCCNLLENRDQSGRQSPEAKVKGEPMSLTIKNTCHH